MSKEWLLGARPVRVVSPMSIIPRILPFNLNPPLFGGADIGREYLQNKKSAKQIAREIGCSHTTILKHLKAEGIAIEGARPNYVRGQVGYGRRAVKGSEIDCKRELETIEKMKSLRLQGFSYHKIADILNTLKIKTKSRKARWHATTVMKILKASENSAGS